MLVSLTVGKVDAGVAVLLTQDKRLIEFPSILLPSSITSGSIVDITVSQNHDAERKSQAKFVSLQDQILNTYGLNAPSTPVLRLRNATQTSLVLEWDPIHLATTSLRSLALYRNGSKAGNIPRPLEMLSTKISGLAVDTEFSFYLVLRTSGGTYTSNTLTVKTHDMSNLTGITITPGILDPQLRASLEATVHRIGARLVDTVRIDTTHFVCTEGRGRDWEKAYEMNIPVVRPEWLDGCERANKIIGVRGYYLDADPKQRQVESASAPSLAPSRADSSATAVNQQTSVPSRPKDPAPHSPDQESTVSGEPGPEVAPTPPQKERQEQKDLPPPPPDAEDDEESEEEDHAEPEAEPEPARPTQPQVATNDKHSTDSSDDEDDDDDGADHETEGESSPPSRSTNHLPPKVEDAKEGSEMEDVAL
ncbi:hypothetical protein PV10_05312 [Exophiala mesophila]|uniref:BRCT domain-containing protein n=1 Tax=Exophiala mesophila TaxID=212818 RepID=A0A0D1ZV33_EXOME|nr:uncharacterized protein PV10_05312 [Exophiala mesophila]KIV90683.1 hypothetical protein PV10_05312 [Exophiala mesophila]